MKPCRTSRKSSSRTSPIPGAGYLYSFANNSIPEPSEPPPAQRPAGRDLLVVLHLRFRRSGHHQSGPAAVCAREPRALVIGHLSVFVVIHILAELEDILRLLADREVIPGDFVQFPVFPFLLLDDAGEDPADRLGFIENRDLELRIPPFQNELIAGLHDEIWIPACRQQIAFFDTELLLPRRFRSHALRICRGERQNRCSDKDQWKCSRNHGMPSFVSDRILFDGRRTNFNTRTWRRGCSPWPHGGTRGCQGRPPRCERPSSRERTIPP